MVTTLLKFATRGLAVSLFVAGALMAQQHAFDGTWQMDPTQSKVNDGRVLTVTIATLEKGGVKVTLKTHKADGSDSTGEFTSKLDGKPCDFAEGTHTSQLTAWFNGPSLNASKEGGPAEDKASMWKFELGANHDTMTLTINHYDPSAADEVLVFKKK